MNFNKLDLLLYLKTGNLNLILYVIALLIVLIPISIILVTDVPFSSSFSKTSISTALGFVISGKLLALLKKNKGDKSISLDIGIILGILIVFISNLLK
ncbi:hypothetical protein [Clostridium hydrogenum]|uniref:hypothetical protein n=1 Tax=Clostridium hydrogenum TaxID=2855764 RepID=UPI001F417FD7|nr:hypothetical protein [Clostridium hydrogenum]